MKKCCLRHFGALFIVLLLFCSLFSFTVSSDIYDWVLGPETVENGAPGEPDYQSCGNPSVIRMDGEYKMWYDGFLDGTYSVCYANSSDGENWVKQGMVYNITVNEAGDNVGTADPYVLYIDSIYKMWYTWKCENYYAGGKDYWSLGYAESDDGLVWVNKTSSLGWTPNHNSTALMHECETYVLVETNLSLKMYFMADSDWDNIRYSASSDGGLNWTPMISLELGYRSPCVIKLDNGSYAMFAATTGQNRKIYCGFSDDGVTNWGNFVFLLEEAASGWSNGLEGVWDPRVVPNTIADNPTVNLSLNLSVGQWFMFMTGDTDYHAGGAGPYMNLGMAWLNSSGNHSCDEETEDTDISFQSINDQGNNTVFQDNNHTFKWNIISNAINYSIRISNYSDFHDEIFLQLDNISLAEWGATYYSEADGNVTFIFPDQYNITEYKYHYYQVRAYTT